MTTFEFISVFIAIIFGLSLAHLLTGAMHNLFHGKLGFERGAYLLFLTVVIIAQWWTFFRWRSVEAWSFDAFSVLVAWALNIFAMPVALYPPGGEVHDALPHRRTLLTLLIAMCVLDVAQTALLGDLFEPWYYLLFLGHYAAFAALALLIQNNRFHKAVAAYFALSIVAWVFIVRRFLT